MALNGEEGRRRVNNERVAQCAAASETSLLGDVRQGRGDGVESRDQEARARGWRPRE